MKLRRPYTQYEGRLFKFGDNDDAEICLMAKFIKREVDNNGPELHYEHYSFGLNDPSNTWYKTTDMFNDDKWDVHEITPEIKKKLVKIVFKWKLERT